MKRVKNYIPADLAKRKIERYKYWSIKDETGITITSSEDTEDGRSFADVLDKIISDNVDAEVQVKFGTNEQSSRQNTPIFVRINQEIEWVEPEEEETVKVNGVPHKVDKNGNVNINLTTPTTETVYPEAAPVDTIRAEMELQMAGLRKEYELKEQKISADLHNKLMEQNLKFKEMLLSDRESRIAEREQSLAQQEAAFEEKQKEMTETVKGYAKHVPTVLGGLVKNWLKNGASVTPDGNLGKTEKPKAARNKVQFSFADEENSEASNMAMQPTSEESDFFDDDLGDMDNDLDTNDPSDIEVIEPEILNTKKDENVQD